MILLACYEGPDPTVRMHRLVWAFAVFICPKTRSHIARPILKTKVSWFYLASSNQTLPLSWQIQQTTNLFIYFFYLFLFSPENRIKRIKHLMQIASSGDNLPEMSNPIFWEKKKTTSICRLLKTFLSIPSRKWLSYHCVWSNQLVKQKFERHLPCVQTALSKQCKNKSDVTERLIRVYTLSISCSSLDTAIWNKMNLLKYQGKYSKLLGCPSI